MLDTKHLASLHSATSFLNSLFLEWPHFEKVHSSEELSLQLRTAKGKIIIPLREFSVLGRHSYTGFFYILENDQKKDLSFSELVHEISQALSLEFQTSSLNKKIFIERVQNSETNIRRTLEHRSLDIQRLTEDKLNFQSAEQSLFLGHTFHPTPKSRSEFSDADFQKFSPEMKGSFPLEWFFVSEDILSQKWASGFKKIHCLKDFYSHEFRHPLDLPEGFLPFPVHPWQKSVLLKNKDIQHYIGNGMIQDLGPSDLSWYPTSSLRTIYRQDAEYMVKFSLSVKLTNSIRHLLVHELDRGLQVHDIFSHPLGEQFLKSYPQFQVIHEPFYAGILDLNQKMIQESLMMFRLNPFQQNKEYVVLATLTQEHPFLKEALIAHHISQLAQAQSTSAELAAFHWFHDFLAVALKPLLMAQANYGILLGSHQQNMILEIEDHRPVKSYFRDCNGTGYSSLGYSHFAQDIQSLVKENGNILETDVASYLFGYYIIINSTFNVINSIAQSHAVSEDDLLNELRIFLLAMKHEGVKDSSFIDYLLYDPHLRHKGNFLCSFNGINENTDSNPLNIYTKIPNPIHERNM